WHSGLRLRRGAPARVDPAAASQGAHRHPGAALMAFLRRKKREANPATTYRRPGPRGWLGPGGGESVLVEPAPEGRGPTVQVCGLWPFGIGGGTPGGGVPAGGPIFTGGTVCCDPISWFQRARLIRNPSMFVLGLPGLGKALDVDTI